MNKKIINITACLVAGLALAVPVPIAIASMVKNSAPIETLDDPIDYSKDSDDLVVDLNNPFITYKDGDEKEVETPNKVILHYHNDDNACLSRRFYTWVTGVDGIERKPDATAEWTATDMAITLDFSQITEYQDSISLFFIIKMAGTWSGQSEDTELVYDKYTVKDGVLEIWTIPGEGTAIEMYETEEETKFPKIQTAKFKDFKTIHCVSTVDKEGKKWVPLEYKLYAFDKSYLSGTESYQMSHKDFYLFKRGVPSTNEFDITFNYTAKINVQYVIESVFPGFEERTQRIIVSSEYLYENERFEKFYTYKGNDLGMTYTKTATTFKVWSPISAYALVNLYDNGTPRSIGGSDVGSSYKMSYTPGGVWEVTINGDLKGKFYTFTLTHSGGTIETMDPYAKACGINGMRGFVYDKDSEEANPAGWDTVPSKWDGNGAYDIKTSQDLTIYEAHIRDLTMDETWVSSNTANPTPRGTYKAFIESGTTYSKVINDEKKTVTTGFDHIVGLGVKAIQLIPVFDQDNDERPEKMKFNWGYNPLNYNCVEGGYSTDPYDPYSRIVEYKNLIKAFADSENHTRIIMDVVYNHVSSAGSSCFTKTMPKYYFRYTDNWEYYDGSGCSNEVKTDATMMRKYIVDSLVWWATEYKIRGFRFDLMGLIDTLTLKQAKEALYAIDPDIYIYGEGWTSGGYHGKNETISIQDSEHGNSFTIGGADNSLIYSQLYETSASKGYVGGFNNAGRDNLKGGNDDGFNGNPYPTWGFISRGESDIQGTTPEVANMLKGINSWAPGANPRQTVNYASCHDNYTLWDQLRYTLQSGQDSKHTPTGAPSVWDTINASIVTHGAVFASNGAAFIQGGEELYRTKSYSYDLEDLAKLMQGGAEAIVRPYPDYVHYSDNPDVIQATSDVRMYNGDVVTHNSYKSPDYVNSFKWDRKIEVDGCDVTGYNVIWTQLIKSHSEMNKVDYPTNLDTPEFNIFYGGNSGDKGVALWNGNTEGTAGYTILFTGRTGVSIPCADLTNTVVYSVGAFNHSDGKMNLSPFTIVVAKK